MSKPLRVRRLTDQEGRELQRIVRRGGGKTEGSVVRWRRASVVLASAGGNTVPVIARLAATSRDRVREVIHRFNDEGMASLDPRWAGGRPRRITTDDEDFIVEACGCRKLCRGWSGGISVLVDESATAGRSNDLALRVFVGLRVAGTGWVIMSRGCRGLRSCVGW